MSRLVPNLLMLHSNNIEDRINDEVAATGLSKSAVARNAIDRGFSQVMEMSRGQILSMTHNEIKMTELPRISAHLARQTNRMISVFASDMGLPVWRIYSLSIDVGLTVLP